MTPERRELDVLAEFPHVIHPGIRGAVNLDDVHGDALGDFQTVGTCPTGGAGGTTLAVERFGQQARHRRLADPARPGKEKRVRDPLRGDGVHEHLHDMRLADHIVEHARPVFSRRNLVIHGSWRARRRLTSYLWAVRASPTFRQLFLARYAHDFLLGGSGAPALPAGNEFVCRNKGSRSATPFHGQGNSWPVGTTAAALPASS